METLDFTNLVRNQVMAIQSRVKYTLDFAIGSVLLAIVEGNASIVIYLQSLILQLLVATRAATSSGDDLDTWMADYGIYRTPAVAASGYVTFSRFTTGQAASIPVGTTVESSDGTQVFTVGIDTTNPKYDAATNSYVLQTSDAEATVPVVASVGGTQGNVAMGGINLITQTVPGIDMVTNADPFINGIDEESDDDFRIRFKNYISSLAKATKNSVIYAVTSVQPNLQCMVVENYNHDGSPAPGYFHIMVDDGTGDPSPSILASVYAAVDAVRPLCSSFGVFPPDVITVDVVMAVTVADGYDSTAVKTNVQTAIASYIDGLGIGNFLPYTILSKIAYDADPGVENVTGITVNGSTSDVTATSMETIKTGTVTVN